jgi:class 3 adenylate cyclase
MFHGLSRLYDEMAEQELHTFLFADIAGYSLVADQDGDEAAAELALYFLSRASSMARAQGAELIKSLGDAVMIHTRHASHSIRLALDLVTEFGQDPALPPIHAGLHTGTALRRADDWWGTTVNIAARVAAAASAGQLLVTEAARLHAGHMAATRWHGLEPLRLKNIRFPIQVYAASRIPERVPARGLILPLESPLTANQTVTA